jgi:hypothetical protein
MSNEAGSPDEKTSRTAGLAILANPSSLMALVMVCDSSSRVNFFVLLLFRLNVSGKFICQSKGILPYGGGDL